MAQTQKLLRKVFLTLVNDKAVSVNGHTTGVGVIVAKISGAHL